MSEHLELLQAVAGATHRPLVASGGVSELADLEALRGLVEGAIIGAAIYERRFTFDDALAASPGRGGR